MHNIVYINILSMIFLLKYLNILIGVSSVIFDVCTSWAYYGHAQRRLMLIRQRRLQISNLEKLSVVRRITLSEYSLMSNVPLSSLYAIILVLLFFNSIRANACCFNLSTVLL